MNNALARNSRTPSFLTIMHPYPKSVWGSCIPYYDEDQALKVLLSCSSVISGHYQICRRRFGTRLRVGMPKTKAMESLGELALTVASNRVQI
nr:hypothetical protein [Pseudomonas syringae]